MWTKSSQQWQLVHGRVELEVRREEICSPGVDETVRLSDGDIRHASDVPDFYGNIRSDVQSAVALVIKCFDEAEFS